MQVERVTYRFVKYLEEFDAFLFGGQTPWCLQKLAAFAASPDSRTIDVRIRSGGTSQVAGNHSVFNHMTYHTMRDLR